MGFNGEEVAWEGKGSKEGQKGDGEMGEVGRLKRKGEGR